MSMKPVKWNAILQDGIDKMPPNSVSLVIIVTTNVSTFLRVI